MDENNKIPKQIEDRIDLVDSWILSPELRSKKIWTILSTSSAYEKKEITNWDIICFCAAYLKQNVAVFPWLLDVVKPLGRLIFNAHYFATAETGLLLDMKIDEETILNGIQQKSENISQSQGVSKRTPRFE